MEKMNNLSKKPQEEESSWSFLLQAFKAEDLKGSLEEMSLVEPSAVWDGHGNSFEIHHSLLTSPAGKTCKGWKLSNSNFEIQELKRLKVGTVSFISRKTEKKDHPRNERFANLTDDNFGLLTSSWQGINYECCAPTHSHFEKGKLDEIS